MYTFENMKEEFIEEQHQLVTNFKEAKGWDWFGYPTVEQLKQNYAQENFTADTRHYAFDEDKLVGFVSSAIQNQEEGVATLQFPFIVTESEEVERELMHHAISKLEEKGAKVIQSNIPSHWKGATDVMEKYGFVKGDVVNNQINVYTKDFDFSAEKPEELSLFVEVDPVADRDGLIEVFKSEMTQTEDQIGEIIDRWAGENANPNLLYNTVAKVDDKIVTHSMGFKNPVNNTATMTHISVYDEKYSHLREIQYKYQAQRIKELGYERIRIFGFTSDPSKDYNFADLKVEPVVQYKLDL